MSSHTKIPQSVVGVYLASTQCMMKRSRDMMKPHARERCELVVIKVMLSVLQTESQWRTSGGGGYPCDSRGLGAIVPGL